LFRPQIVLIEALHFDFIIAVRRRIWYTET